MKNYSTKFKHIVPTFIYIAIGTTVSVILFRWFFTIYSDILPIKEDVFGLWLPIILPWIPITIWLRPKLRILRFTDETRRIVFQLIAAFTITAMLLISDSYLKLATGKMIELNSVEQLAGAKAKFLRIHNITVDTTYGSVHTEFRVSGKSNEYLNFESYFVHPFKVARTENQLKYWYAVKFKEQISNRLSTEAKEEKYRMFFEKSVKEFEFYNFSRADYYEVLRHSNDREGFVQSVKNLKHSIPRDLIIIQPQKGFYSQRMGTKLEWIFGSFAIGLSVFLFALMFPKYHKAEHRRQLKGIKPRSDEVVDMFRFLIPKKPHFATSVILDLNILVFLLMIFSGIHITSPSGNDLLEWGANRRTETLGGEWWRLVTSMFLHSGFMHLVLNIVGLVMAALFIEPIFDRSRYFILYFFSGLCGSFASILWYNNIISIGASGAIFGLYGAILALLLTKAFPKGEKKSVALFFAPYIIINLLFGLGGGIDNAAHLGGLISGAISGWILYRTKRDGNGNI